LDTRSSNADAKEMNADSREKEMNADSPEMEKPDRHWNPFTQYANTRREFLRNLGVAGVGWTVVPFLGIRSSDSYRQPALTGVPTMGVELTVNQKRYHLDLDPRVTLLDALRENLSLTGTKKGCDRGQCGACTVLLDDRRVNSCLILAVTCQGAGVTTIEGLGDGDRLHAMQDAFIRHDAYQCGYCTPGQICSAVGLLKEGHARTTEEIRESMSGNICRCGAYNNILDAIHEVQSKT
jgi:xanthine dehydrogenase YagT iron-sulfur-binding subunit